METRNLGQKIKISAIITGLIIAGLVVGYVLGVFGAVKVIVPYVSKIKYQRAVEEYLKPYKEDFVGGDTPEQTIDLFIAALKKGDYELASKYFTVEQQEEWYKKFIEMRNAGRGQGLIDELENAKKIWHKEKQGEDKFEFWYNTGEGKNEITNFIVLRKNVNNKWKISSF